MAIKRWFLLFFLCIFVVFGSVAALNVYVDPFGVFRAEPDSMSFTNNPRAAKIAWTERVGWQFDSYIVGASLTSSYPVEKLNEYTGGNFYNMFGYGADMKKTADIARYLLKNHEIQNLIVNISPVDAQVYDLDTGRITDEMHYKVSGENALTFYFKFLFANPRFALEKLKNQKNDTYLPQSFDVFNVGTGAYDKRVREVEKMHSFDEYLANNSTFTSHSPTYRMLSKIPECVAEIADIKAICEEKGVNVTFIFSPMYYPDFQAYSPAELADFQREIAKVTDFWDFSLSSVSLDARYFYDPTHFRNEVGAMALARIYGNETAYVPDDFGAFVTAENVESHAELFFRAEILGENATDFARRVTVLTYHSISDDPDNAMCVTEADFERQLLEYSAAGYETVSLRELVAFVEKGDDLPEKPLVITFDDGYLDNYSAAFPILQKHGMKAVIFAIGVSVGKDTYKDTGTPIFPHFSYAQAAEMVESGLVEVYSHSFDMHQSQTLDENPRSGVLQRENETEHEYIGAFRDDFEKSCEFLEGATGAEIIGFAYPEGRYTNLSEALLIEMGVKVTMSTNAGTNVLVRGLPQTLLALNRITMR